MPGLTANQQEDCKFYLGYTSPAVPQGDALILNKRILALGYTTQWLARLDQLLLRCKNTWEKSEMDLQDSGITYRRNITGDTNRTDIEHRPESLRTRERQFVKESDRLGRYLGVRNYNNPDNWDNLSYSEIRH